MPDRGYYAPAMSDFSGELYRYPFANINLRPSWLGPHYAQVPKNVAEGIVY